MILSKDTNFFGAFVSEVKKAGMPHGASTNSIRIVPTDDTYVLLYDRADGSSDIFEKYEIPNEAASQGYRYGYLVECRSEKIFCEIFGSKSLHLDMLICDSEGVLYRPDELSPDTIVL